MRLPDPAIRWGRPTSSPPGDPRGTPRPPPRSPPSTANKCSRAGAPPGAPTFPPFPGPGPPRRAARPDPPLGVRVPPDPSHSRARGIHENLVEPPGGGRKQRAGEIVEGRPDPLRPGPRHHLAQHPEPQGRDVRGQDRRLPPGEGGQVRRLPARGGAGVEDPIPRRRGKDRGD